MPRTYDVAAYVWPSYTGDEPRTRMFWPEGLGEWETVRKAGPKFPGHAWPRRPCWGYVNEADPRVMEMQIDAAADHGVNVFIYDWYWYDRRPFLENCLNDGFLAARNNHRMKFYLMWANHDVNNLWDIRLSNRTDANTIWLADVDRAQFDRVADRWIEKYFLHPAYYRIEDKPVLMIYDLAVLLRGLRGPDAARDALDALRARAVVAGLPGLHVQACARHGDYRFRCPIDGRETSQADMFAHLGLDSVTHYQFVHMGDIDRDYDQIVPDMAAVWERFDGECSIPYVPHVSVGWDANPRFTEFRPGIVKNNTPAAVRAAFEKARQYLDARPDRPPLVTVNSWNEWTETSYLQPDDLYGYGYLEAIRDVFVNAE